MADVFWIKTHDLRPPVTATLVDANLNPVDLSGASGVRFMMRLIRGSTLIVDENADIVDATAGEVLYDWQEGDTDEAGGYWGEFEVLWDGTIPETFPSPTYVRIAIVDDLDVEGS